MIKAFYKNDIIDRLGAIITYGLENNYSFSSIENSITASYFIKELERNNYDISCNIVDIVRKTYLLDKLDDFNISFKGLFIAESYVRLFFDLNKSFEYLFLYWPLEHFVNTYNVYHEMDYTNLKNDFLDLVNKDTLLRKLSKSRNIKFTEIARLTGISENTIKYYASNDSSLYKAPFDVIFDLCNIFGVGVNIFLKKLSVYLDNTVYLSDLSNDEYRNYLGYYFGLFYGLFPKDDFYLYKNKFFISNDNKSKIYVRSLKSDDLTASSFDEIDNKSYNYLILFINNVNKEKIYPFFKKSFLNEIMVVSSNNVYFIKKNQSKEITDTINRSLIIRANKALEKESI